METRQAPYMGLADARVQAALREFQVGLTGLYGVHAPVVLVYGSYARDEATEDSDVDLLLLYRGSVNASLELRRLVPILADINLRYGLLLSVLPVDSAAYRDAQGPFWRNVRREGVPLHVD